MRKNGHYWGWLVAACIVLAAASADAEQVLYSLDIPDAQAAHFEVPIEVEHAGKLTVHADWEGNRTLAFRIESTSRDRAVARRSGPPPISLFADVLEEDLGSGEWKLVIHALPLRGASLGRLTIDLPKPEKPVVAEIPVNGRYAAAPPPQQREWWEQPRQASTGWTRPQSALTRATETFRQLIVENPRRPPDTCRWQDDLLRWLATQRDTILDEGTEPDAATGKLVTAMAEAIRDVEKMRLSSDPLIVGPVPRDAKKRQGWMRLREDRLRDLVDDLDELINNVQRNHAPELENEQWPLRLASCITASQRYFDERWIRGEDRAANRELAENQWALIQRAADALEAVATLSEDDVIRLGKRKN